MLTRFFRPGIAIANHAESSETLKPFISELRLAKILSQIETGDYLFIQFGHNDMKTNWPQTYSEAFTTYSQYLRIFIAEARFRRAKPVLVIPCTGVTSMRTARSGTRWVTIRRAPGGSGSECSADRSACDERPVA
jgi:lysophospholipase L1-like esterase